MNYTFLIITLAVISVVLLLAAFTRFSLSNEGYDRLKSVVTKWDYIVIFIALIVKTFNVAYGLETVAIVAGLGALLAGLLGISKINYKGEKLTQMFNEDLLKDMLGFSEDVLDEVECEEESEEDEESEE